ncbi:MAG: spore coat associated protein CotJA [Maledivibacter sp.]|jgi:hypothetical protein|nr:spore coat associated protein CotJA [Maledivibacter sp.]
MNKNHEDKCTLTGKCELARPYIMNQPFTKIYPLEEALMRGTIFPDLYRPYVNREKKEGK